MFIKAIKKIEVKVLKPKSPTGLRTWKFKQNS